MSMLKVVEILAQSEKSWEDAAQLAGLHAPWPNGLDRGRERNVAPQAAAVILRPERRVSRGQRALHE